MSLLEPSLTASETIIAAFDVQVAAMREMLVTRLAELGAGLPQVKRPRGRPKGSWDKGPRRPNLDRNKK
jgi:hypothetical protein